MIAADYIGIGVAVALILFLVLFYLWIYLRNRSLGSPGLVSRSRLTCPKCHRTFDFQFIPGASFTAIRLGTGRYMSCPLCHRWSFFELYRNQVPAGSSTAGEQSTEESGASQGGTN
jgi:hypothetical protein